LKFTRNELQHELSIGFVNRANVQALLFIIQVFIQQTAAEVDFFFRLVVLYEVPQPSLKHINLNSRENTAILYSSKSGLVFWILGEVSVDSMPSTPTMQRSYKKTQ
jgi:hypothetical protein